MKPVIIKTSDGIMADISLSDINALINQVYDEGYRDGAADERGRAIPITVPSTNPIIHWDLPTPAYPYEFTCTTTDDPKEYLKNLNEEKGEITSC